MNLLDLYEGREPHQQAIDRLEQARIAHLEEKMDYYAKHGMVKEFKAAKEERDSYHKVKTNEGQMKQMMHKDAERMEREAFCNKYGNEDWVGEFWDNVNGPLDEGSAQIGDIITCPGDVRGEIIADEGDRWVVRDLDSEFEDDELEFRKSDCKNYVGEAGIGHDIVNRTEKMARATPPSKAGAVASTVKNAAKWLAGKGGPGKEGPTYEGANDIEDRGEYDQEGDMVKDNLHTIRREAEELERILSDNENVPEWVQDKLAQVKGMITSASEYMQTQRERDHEEATGEEGVTFAEAQKKNSKEIDEHGGGGGGPRQWHAYVRAHRADEGWSDAVVAQRTGRPRTPYSVYIKGRKWKDFENDDHAEAVANKLRAKFKAEGRDPSVITIAPTDYDKGLDEHGGGVNSMKQYIAWRKSANKERGITKKQPVGKMSPKARAVPKGTVHGKLDQSRGVIPSSSFHEDEMAEAQTDYSKRRQRERDVDAGKPVAKPRQPKMTDYQRRRAQQKKDMELGEELGAGGMFSTLEEQDTSGVESAILRRIMVAHTDWLQKFGPQKVMQAAEEVAYNVGDVEEIGTSDVSAYVHEVGQILGVDQLDEKWSAKYKRSIDCSHPKGFSQRAHCAGRKK